MSYPFFFICSYFFLSFQIAGFLEIGVILPIFIIFTVIYIKLFHLEGLVKFRQIRCYLIPFYCFNVDFYSIFWKLDRFDLLGFLKCLIHYLQLNFLFYQFILFVVKCPFSTILSFFNLLYLLFPSISIFPSLKYFSSLIPISRSLLSPFISLSISLVFSFLLYRLLLFSVLQIPSSFFTLIISFIVLIWTFNLKISF